MLFRLVNAHSQHGELKPGYSPAQEVETRTGNFHSAFHIYPGNTFAKLQMVFRLKAFCLEITQIPNLFNDYIIIFPAFRGFRLNYIGQFPHSCSVFFRCLIRSLFIF